MTISSSGGNEAFGGKRLAMLKACKLYANWGTNARVWWWLPTVRSVSTTATFERLPALRAMYDNTGVAGIPNMGATANVNTNVDVAGDIPHCLCQRATLFFLPCAVTNVKR